MTPAGLATPTAAGKVLDVLGAFGTEARQFTLSAIARRSGLALSTAHRVVAELVAWGALERGDDGLYRIGLRLYEVGALAPRGVALRDAAMPFMEDLYEITHEVVRWACARAPSSSSPNGSRDGRRWGCTPRWDCGSPCLPVVPGSCCWPLLRTTSRRLCSVGPSRHSPPRPSPTQRC